LRTAGPLLKNQSTDIGARIVPSDGYLVFSPDLNNTTNTPLKWTLGIDISGDAPNKRVTCAIEPFQPRSVGKLKLQSSDPFVDPSIDPAFLTDQAGYDYSTYVAGLRECRRIYSFPPLSDILQGPETERTPGWSAQSDDEIGAFIKATANEDGHPVGTCKMGPNSDPYAVVDALLRVRGVKGLRVVDASIMPYITSGNTNTPTALIATKAAKFILHDAGTSANNEKSTLVTGVPVPTVVGVVVGVAVFLILCVVVGSYLMKRGKLLSQSKYAKVSPSLVVPATNTNEK